MYLSPALHGNCNVTVGGEVLICFALFSFFHALHACLLIDTLLSATPTCSQLFSFVEVRKVYPWLAMLRDRLTNTTDAYQLNRFANG